MKKLGILILFLAALPVLAQHSVTLIAQPSPTANVTYEVYRDGVLYRSGLTMPAALDAMVVAGNTYRYTMRAVDASGAESIDSNSVSPVIPSSAPTPIPTPAPPPQQPGCSNTGTTWTATALPAPQSAPFTFTFSAVPPTGGLDAVVGLSAAVPAGYGDLAAMVRFNSAGAIDVYNGATSVYTADAMMPWSAGSQYSVREVVDPVGKKYDVFVSVNSAAEVKIASGYAFRAQSTTIADEGQVSETGSLQVCALSVAAIAPPKPVIPPDITAPVISSFSCTKNSVNAYCDVTVTDNTGVTSLTVSVNGVVVDTHSIASPRATMYRTLWPIATFAKGSTVLFSVTAKDAAGNSASKSASVKF